MPLDLVKWVSDGDLIARHFKGQFKVITRECK